MFGARCTIKLAVVLLSSCCFCAGQQTNFGDDASCTYSFAVQSRLCTQDPRSKAEVGVIQENVAQLRNQVAQMAREIAFMKNGNDMNAKFVYLVSDIGDRVLMVPLMPHFPVFCTVDKFIVIQGPGPLVFSWPGEKIHQITTQPFVRWVLMTVVGFII
ncbi:hypothetical protein NP493_8581g00001 [Ridgeia piscesae]|uniref:Uncharacterized protein n=1 Tax=Ridgeia piscesae TaxID=27915 RepID=A0AAD9INU7_RIDPI|nr:hypothetical protein NP493_8581g00001 [Ridgeia piscesae]